MLGGRIRWWWIAAAGVAGWYAAIWAIFVRRNLEDPILLDFASFWAAGRLVLEGSPSAAFDLSIHKAMIVTALGPVSGTMPFPYPPPFLFFVTPFATLPYFASFAAWVLATGALYLWASRKLTDLPYAAAQPAVLINVLIGQNGFLLSGIFLAGVTRLAERPFMAGLILGLLVIKPQLALLLPVAVVAARAWPAVAGAAISIATLLMAALLAFGWQSYSAFLDLLPRYSEWMAANRFDWDEFASPFGLSRSVGAPGGVAMTVQVAAAAAAVLLCWRAWRHNWEERAQILCAGTLLMSPYLQSYDTLLMIAPIAWWLKRSPSFAALLWLLCAAILAHHMHWWSGPDLTSLAALLAIGRFWWDKRPASSLTFATA